MKFLYFVKIDGGLNIRQNFEPILEHFYEIGSILIVANGEILKNYSNHLVTLTTEQVHFTLVLQSQATTNYDYLPLKIFNLSFKTVSVHHFLLSQLLHQLLLVLRGQR